MNKKGIVSKVSNHDGRFGIEIDGVWYNGFGTVSVKSGDEVEFEYLENKGKDGKTIFRNVELDDIKVLSISSKKESFGREPSIIVKTDCYRMAVDLCIAGRINPDQIEPTAVDLFSKINK